MVWVRIITLHVHLYLYQNILSHHPHLLQFGIIHVLKVISHRLTVLALRIVIGQTLRIVISPLLLKTVENEESLYRLLLQLQEHK